VILVFFEHDQPIDTFVFLKLFIISRGNKSGESSPVPNRMIFGLNSALLISQYNGKEKIAFALASILVSWIWFTGLAVAGRITGGMDKSGRLMVVLNKISALVMWGAAIYIRFTLTK
jgi:hypothetical protein